MREVKTKLYEFHELEPKIQEKLIQQEIHELTHDKGEFDEPSDKIGTLVDKTFGVECETYFRQETPDDVFDDDEAFISVCIYAQDVDDKIIAHFPNLVEINKDWEIEFTMEMEITDQKAKPPEITPDNKHTKPLAKYIQKIAQEKIVPELKRITKELKKRENTHRTKAIKAMKGKWFHANGNSE